MRNRAALAWVGLTLAIVLSNVLAPPSFGPLALGAIFEPYIVVSALLAGVAALRAAPRPASMLVLVLIAVAIARYAPVWTSSPPAPDVQPLKVSSWNMEAGAHGAERASEGISASSADLIALQELEPAVAAALTAEATGFEHRAFAPDLKALDVGLLSRVPILESQVIAGSLALRVVVAPPGVEPVVVYVVHPQLARYVHLGDIPVGLDLSVRDRSISVIRSALDEDLRRGRSVIVMGDLNTTEREAAYAQLAAGLRDAHLDAGTGPGLTWRPSPLAFLPVGMLRIDYVLSTPDLFATSVTVNCRLRSDHCRVDVALATTRGNAGPNASETFPRPALPHLSRGQF